MSCPDWKALTAWRDARDGRDGVEEPAGYRKALAHLDGGCTACRRQALAADPTLMFRMVPVMDIPAAQENDEVEAMRLAVAAMRTASRMEALETRRTRQGWWKWASAAMLAVAALSVAPDGRFRAEQESLRAASGRIGLLTSATSAGFDAAPTLPVYDPQFLPAGAGADDGSLLQIVGDGPVPLKVNVAVDDTMPEEFFDI